MVYKVPAYEVHAGNEVPARRKEFSIFNSFPNKRFDSRIIEGVQIISYLYFPFTVITPLNPYRNFILQRRNPRFREENCSTTL